MNFRNWSDDQLCEAYERNYRSPVFANTPRWKKASLWIVCILFPAAGLTAIAQMVARAPWVLGVMVLLGAVGLVCLAFVLVAERNFNRTRDEVTAELLRRGLYDRPTTPPRS